MRRASRFGLSEDRAHRDAVGAAEADHSQGSQFLGAMCERIDCDKVEVHEGTDDPETNTNREVWLRWTKGRSITLGNHIIVGTEDIDDETQSVALEVLAHEMTHVGQFQEWGPMVYSLAGLVNQGANSVGNWFGLRNPMYQVGQPMNLSWEEYGMEQQAEIVRFCYLGSPKHCERSPYSF